MLRRIRRSALTRLTAVFTGAFVVWSTGPSQAAGASMAGAKRGARSRNSVMVGSNATTHSWDYPSRLSGITYPNSFTYNDLGQRTSKTDSAGTSASLYDGSRVLADSRADYTNGGLTGLISERASGTTLTYHGDQIGSTRGLTNGNETVTASRERDAWGNVVASTGALAGPFGFVGGQGYQEDADSGLMRLGARYYDASVGRFVSRDPLRYEAGDANLYRYCGNNPANSADPSGCLVWLIPVALVLVAAALVADAGGVSSLPDQVDTAWTGVNTTVGYGLGMGGDYRYDEDRGVTVIKGGWWISNQQGVEASTWGETILIQKDVQNLERTLTHEMVHVDESRVMGPASVPLYWGGTGIGLLRGDHYYKNPFEEAAFRVENRVHGEP